MKIEWFLIVVLLCLTPILFYIGITCFQAIGPDLKDNLDMAVWGTLFVLGSLLFVGMGRYLYIHGKE